MSLDNHVTYGFNHLVYVCYAAVIGLDDLLAQHIAHLFIRDPISLFGEKLEQDIETETDHFEVSVQHVGKEGGRDVVWSALHICSPLCIHGHPPLSSHRTSSPPTGKACGSSLRPLTRPSDGGWSSVPWKYS